MTVDKSANRTLREKLSEAEKLARELIHHLEHGFIPKVHTLRRLARQGLDPTDAEEVSDRSFRSQVDEVISSDDFTRRVYTQFDSYLSGIQQDVRRITGD